MKISIERLVAEVFGGCNYECQMCPQGEGGRDPEFLKQMPFELFEEILDDASQYGDGIVVNLDGSGEATLNKNFTKYVKAVADRGFKPLVYTNGLLVKGDYMREIFDAGMYLMRFSDIGYNRETYKEWMRIDAFDKIIKNAREAREYVEQQNLNATVSSYHLILDNQKVDWEIEQYRKNFIEPAGTEAEIWKMHNWSGNLDFGEVRQGEVLTCGRPFAPDFTVRAGGIGKHYGAVTPCCQTMGPPNEIPSVLGHMDTQTIEEVYNSEASQNLRKAHTTGDWSLAPYCEHCDFRIQDPEVLVWTNNSDHVRKENMRATKFNLEDYK
jgi:MoaA/NifB/PqqE/SkfB family radical SAM enzyme